MSQGFGTLKISKADTGLFTFIVAEGSGVVTEMQGGMIDFQLWRAPLPSQYDIREMSTAEILIYVGRRLQEAGETSDQIISHE